MLQVFQKVLIEFVPWSSTGAASFLRNGGTSTRNRHPTPTMSCPRSCAGTETALHDPTTFSPENLHKILRAHTAGQHGAVGTVPRPSLPGVLAGGTV